MDLKMLADNFEILVDAPGAVENLRKLILKLAAAGRLVPQVLSDGVVNRYNEATCNSLTQQTAHYKAPAHKVPISWAWLPIKEYADIIMGQSPPSDSYYKTPHGLPFFQGKADFGKFYPSVANWCTAPSKIAEAGDILITVRAPVGPTNIAAEKCCIGRGLAALRCPKGSNNFFLLYVLRSLETEIASLGSGSTFAAITKRDIQDFKVPIAPFPEQYRIVAKVDRLMQLCDELEVKISSASMQRQSLLMAVFKQIASDH